jgi:hypothetical protein
MARPSVPLSLVVWLLGAPLSAQTDQNSTFYRLLQAHLDSMSRDTLVKRLSQRPEGLSIGDVLPPDMLLRLSDTSLVRLASLLTVSFAEVDSATCATFLPGGTGPDIISLAARVDSGTARQWLRLVHQMMLTGLLNLPRGRLAPPDSVLAALRLVAEAESPEDRRRLLAVAGSPSGMHSDPCFVAQHTFRKLMAMPPRQAGPLMRTLLAGVTR